MEHGSPGTTITVGLRGDDKNVAISIRRNYGAAIPADRLNTLFKPMKIREEPRKRSDSGPTGNLGLGLYIAEQIVHAHRGRIEVDSSEAQGTTFTIHLPRRA